MESKSNDRKYYETRLHELYKKYSGLMVNSNRINQNTVVNYVQNTNSDVLRLESGQDRHLKRVKKKRLIKSKCN